MALFFQLFILNKILTLDDKKNHQNINLAFLLGFKNYEFALLAIS